jgi:hypothetical protein
MLPGWRSKIRGRDDHTSTTWALTGHPGDGGVLSDAWQAGADFFVTLDRPFLDNGPLLAACLRSAPRMRHRFAGERLDPLNRLTPADNRFMFGIQPSFAEGRRGRRT